MIEHDTLHTQHYKNIEFLIIEITTPSETRIYQKGDVIALANMEHLQARSEDDTHFLHIKPKTGTIPVTQTKDYNSEEELIEDTPESVLDTLQENNAQERKHLASNCRICYQHDSITSTIHYCEAMGDVHAPANAHEFTLSICTNCREKVESHYQEIQNDILNEQLVANLL